jgi:UDP-sugar pyrophosphorylase
LITEFINPKYTDSTKTKFKSASRLECMMQDYPKLLENGDRVGFTQIDRKFCFTTCKNDIKVNN